MGAGVGHLELLSLEAPLPGSREMHKVNRKLQCGVSPHLSWPNCGQILVPYDLSRLWVPQVKPAVSLPPIRNAPPTPGREAREFRNFFLDKRFQSSTIFTQHNDYVKTATKTLQSSLGLLPVSSFSDFCAQPGLYKQIPWKLPNGLLCIFDSLGAT